MKNVFDRNIDGKVDGEDVKHAAIEFEAEVKETRDSIHGMTPGEQRALKWVFAAGIVLALGLMVTVWIIK